MERDGGQIPTPPYSLPGLCSGYRGARVKQLRGKEDPSRELAKNTRQTGWGGQYIL